MRALPRKTNKRGQNEGSIIKRADGTYEARYSLGFDKDGKRIRKSIYSKNRTELSQRLTAILNQINCGLYVEPSKLTVAEWLDTWLQEYKHGSVKPSTYGCYVDLVKGHIKPLIGNIPLKDLQPHMIQKLVNDLHRQGRAGGNKALSSSSLRKTHAILHCCLEQAVTNGLMVKNVADKIKLPRQAQKQVKALSKDEQAIFIEAAEGERLKFLFQFALGTGLRVGELCGLRWNNADIKKGIIQVKEQVQRVKNPHGDTATMMIVCDVKTKSGNRSIPLPDSLLALLKQHKINQLQERLQAGAIWTDNNIVFANEIGGYLEQRNVARAFHRVQERAGLKGFNVHSLRHTYATRLLESGISPKVAQELMGHSTIAQTLDTYSHVLPETKQEAVQALNGLF